ncbi:MAG: hypothetical protein R6T90_03015 [Dissulfuribacterales bacterium]
MTEMKQPKKVIEFDFNGGENVAPEAEEKSVQEQLQEMSEETVVVHHDPELTLEEVTGALFNGEIGVGYIVAKIYRNHFVYNYTRKHWYKFNGVLWEIDKKQEVIDAVRNTHRFLSEFLYEHLRGLTKDNEKYIKSVINSMTNYDKMKKILDQARSGKDGLSVTGDEFDSHRQYIGAPNGIIDLHTGNLLPGDPEMYISKKAGTAYDPEPAYP